MTWSVESTALVGDELVPATYSAVATYSGTASSTVATGYITTAEYSGKVTASGIASIQYTVTYLGSPIQVEEEIEYLPIILGAVACAGALLLLVLLIPRKNVTVYESTGNGNEYDKAGRLRLKIKSPELRVDKLKNVPEGVIAIEVDESTAKKLFGKSIAVRYYDNTFRHTVGTVNGQYWFKVDVGTQPGEPDMIEEARHEN